MNSVQEYEVSFNNFNEKLILTVENNDNITEIIINYKDLIFSTVINENTSASTNYIINNIGIDIHSFILYLLENEGMNINFMLGNENEIEAFEVKFNVNINDLRFVYPINLICDYDRMIINIFN